MFYWIYDLSTPAMAGWFALVFVGFSWIGAVLVRPLLMQFVRARLGATNDSVGYLLSCYSVFYGLLLGLLAVAAYQNYRKSNSPSRRKQHRWRPSTRMPPPIRIPSERTSACSSVTTAGM
jgi:hypothetical protein